MNSETVFGKLGVGQKDTAIDDNGICMASIQGLYKLFQEQAARLKQQEEQQAKQAAELEHLLNLFNQR